MALIACSECSRQISDRAQACPHCGCPTEMHNQIACSECSQQISDRAQACPHCGCPTEMHNQIVSPAPQDSQLTDFAAKFPHPGPMPQIYRAGKIVKNATDLGNRFDQMGTLQGRTLEEIVRVVGPAKSRGAQAFGKELHQWLLPPFHVCLIFDYNGICGGVTHISR